MLEGLYDHPVYYADLYVITPICILRVCTNTRLAPNVDIVLTNRTRQGVWWRRGDVAGRSGAEGAVSSCGTFWVDSTEPFRHK